MNLCFILNKKILLAFLSFIQWQEYKTMPMLIEDKTVTGMGSFVALSFAYYSYISKLSFISILTFYFTPRHSENI